MIGNIISHYKIIEEIGQGGMGVVYKAQDTRLKRPVALKFLHDAYLKNNTGKFVRAHNHAPLRMEAQAAASVNHPNVCTIYEIDEADGHVFIAMEYVEGRTLKDLIPLIPPLKKGDKGGLSVNVGAHGHVPLPMDTIIDYATQIAAGLQAIHEKGLAHRDIKSENILITDKGQVKIMDFGLVKSIRIKDKLTKEDATCGTVTYMSPEQIRGEDLDHRTDIWSFGVVLFEMLTGQLPFTGENAYAMIDSILNEDPESLKNLLPEISKSLENIVEKVLTKDPNGRYQSMKDFLGDLKRLQTEPSPKETLIPLSDSLVQIIRRPKIIVLTTVILIIVFGIMLLVTNRNKKIQWAKYEAISEIKRLMDDGRINDSYNLAVKAEKVIPDNPKLVELWPYISRPFTIDTDPQDAMIYWKEYAETDDPWIYLEKTPIDSIRLPIGLKQVRNSQRRISNGLSGPKYHLSTGSGDKQGTFVLMYHKAG